MHPQLHEFKPTQRKLISKNIDIKEEQTNDYWLKIAMDHVNKKKNENFNFKKAKNVIMFLGDGMSHASLCEYSIY